MAATTVSDRGGRGRGWLIVLAMAVLFFAWGIFIYLTVGEKGPHPWDMGVVKDIPGESPYSTSQSGAGVAPPARQHVSDETSGAPLVTGE